MEKKLPLGAEILERDNSPIPQEVSDKLANSLERRGASAELIALIRNKAPIAEITEQ